MKNLLDKKIKTLAHNLSCPLYVVGGFVRNFLISKEASLDIDVCGAMPVEQVELAVKEMDGKAIAVYKRTGTLVFFLSGRKYEYTRFRKDGYSAGGKYQPDSVEWTENILEDAVRRDFKCNAIYYDILKGEFVDPLGGINDVKNKVLDTVKSPKEVFSHDGLRLLRLARFSGELGFTPTEEVLKSARENAENIKDISVERIWEEIKRILLADNKYDFSPKEGHYIGLKILDQTEVLDKIFPELTAGRGLSQPKEYHDYDVLEHSLRCVLYADKKVRIPALLHDIAKPKLMAENGNSYKHELEGEKLAKEILSRLKADKKTIEITCRIIKAHMLDMDCKMKESKVRNFIIENADIYEQILLLKQADFSATKDDLSISPTVKKWQDIFQKMKAQNMPFSVKDLKISAKQLIKLGYEGERIGKELDCLWKICRLDAKNNDEEYLTKKAKEHLEGKTSKRGF